MEMFTASNGTQVVPITAPGVAKGIAVAPDFGCRTNIYDGDVQALREFFLHERDQELGRWRERPDCTTVVYPNGADDLGNRCVIVLYEPTAGVTAVYENSIPGNLYGDAARNYFAAHPELKPWHEAKPGEVWELTTRGVDDRWNPTAFYVGDRESGAHTIEAAFFPVESDYSVSHLGIRAAAITAGRRIWPEVSDD